MNPSDPRAVDAWGRFIGTVGFPIALWLLSMAIGYVVLRWLAPRAEKLITRHISLMDTVDQSVQSLTVMAEEAARRDKRQCALLRRLARDKPDLGQ